MTPRVRAWLRLAPLIGVLLLWNAGSEDFRGDRPDLQEKFDRDPAALLWPPWGAVQAFVSRDSDEKIYFNYARLVFGQEPDLAFLARRRDTSPEQLRVRPGPGARLPYRDFSLEYPPGALAAFLPPYLIASSIGGYRLAFGLWMALATLGAALLAARLEGDLAARGKLYRRAAWVVFAIGPLLAVRFDALPAALVVLALVLAERRRWLGAGALLGAGVAVKVYPLLLLPVLAAFAFAGDRARASVRLAAGAAAGAAVVVVPWLVVAGAPMLRDLSVHGTRPLQLETVLGTPLLFTAGTRVVQGFGSANFDAPGAGALLALTTPLALASLGLACVLAWRAGRTRAPGAIFGVAAVCLLGALSTSKVLSPQYLIWLCPLAALVPGRAGTVILHGTAVAALLAQLFFPFFYDSLKQLEAPFVHLLAARNLVLVATWLAGAALLWSATGARRPAFGETGPLDAARSRGS